MTPNIRNLVYAIILLLFNQNIFGQMQFQYNLIFKSQNFNTPIKYLEDCIYDNNKKFSIAKLKDYETDLSSHKEIAPNETNSEFIPNFLYSIYYDINTRDAETCEMILLMSQNSDDLFAIKDSLETINWVITNESKSIDNFKCFKAEANFRCKKYIAWFTPDIPIPSGPWKLNGLPGLIIEAYDENKIRHYLLEKFSPDTERSNVKELVNSIKTKKEFTGTQVREFFAKVKENLEAKGLIANSSMDCLDCRNTESKLKIDLWECY